jgi:proline iminopeptidase
MLEAGEGNRLYWETVGARTGQPALVLHGGPGSGCGPWWGRLFDPDRYRVVLLDQRGCGRSFPNAGDPTTDLSTNTTRHLLSDIELLRCHLEIERWLILGGSWGSTLALAYAEAYPDRVSALVLFSVTTTTRREVEWATRDIGRVLPAAWTRFRAGVPEAERDGDPVAAYARLLANPDPFIRGRASRDWCEWDDAQMRAGTDRPADPRFEDPGFRLCFARLVTHYWRHGAWLADGALLDGVGALAEIPGVLVHGRLDFGSPLDIPWELARAWPTSHLEIIDGEGHAGGSAMDEALVAATDRLARTL